MIQGRFATANPFPLRGTILYNNLRPPISRRPLGQGCALSSFALPLVKPNQPKGLTTMRRSESDKLPFSASRALRTGGDRMTAIGSCCRAGLRGIALTHKEFSFVLSLANKRKYRQNRLIPEREQDNWNENFLLYFLLNQKEPFGRAAP